MDPVPPKENIFLFVPNIIGKENVVGMRSTRRSFFLLGYVRIVFSLISFYFMPSQPVVAVSCYLISELLDALDGHAARALGQSESIRQRLP